VNAVDEDKQDDADGFEKKVADDALDDLTPSCTLRIHAALPRTLTEARTLANTSRPNGAGFDCHVVPSKSVSQSQSCEEDVLLRFSSYSAALDAFIRLSSSMSERVTFATDRFVKVTHVQANDHTGADGKDANGMMDTAH